MEDGILHFLWFLQMTCHAIWVDQRPFCFPKVHEWYIQWHARCPCYHLPRWHTSLLRQPHWTQKTCLWGLRQNRLYCKSEKCHFDKDTVNYLGFVLSQNGSNYTGLAWTTKCERHLIFPRFCKLLPLFHLELLWHCRPTHLAHPQRCPMELLWCCLQILPIIENCVHYRSYPYSLDSRQTTYHQDGHLRLCSGCYPLITAWFWWNPPCSFPLLYIHPTRTQLWYPR